MAFEIHNFQWDDAHGQPGKALGGKGIQRAIDQGASPFQLRQLLQRAKRTPGLTIGSAVSTIQHGKDVSRLDPKIRDMVQRQWGTSFPGIAEQSEVGWDFFGGEGVLRDQTYGFGLEDLERITGGNIHDYSHADRVMELRDWAEAQKIGVGKKIGDYLRAATEAKDKGTLTQIDDIIQDPISNEDIAQVQEITPEVEPPKPKFRVGQGHFVPGTTRVASQIAPRGRSRASSFRDRFNRMGRGFRTSPLAIGGGSAGSQANKVLNV